LCCQTLYPCLHIFSPEGNFIALSEQGYDPLTLGGSGHQESSAIHIANADTLDIINSFTGHGTTIKEDRNKKVIFVAFSEDEKKIMSMSADGVVIVRNINI
jgi:WD40 repeat protein